MNIKYLLIMIMLMIPILSIQVHATWANASLLYKQQINITEASNTTLSDYSVNVTFDTNTPIMASKLDTSCNCIAFYNSTENGLLHSYLSPKGFELGSTGCNVTNSLFWVFLPSISNLSNTTIYAYYNSTCGNNYTADPEAYLIWDDFTGANNTTANTTRWTRYLGCYIWSNEMNCTDLGGYTAPHIYSMAYTGITGKKGLYASVSMKQTDSSYTSYELAGDNPNTANTVSSIKARLTTTTGVYLGQEVATAWTDLFKNLTLDELSYNKFAIWANSTSFSFWINENGTYMQKNATNALVGNTTYIVRFTKWSSGVGTGWWDNFTLRWLVYPEPTIALVGAEQQNAVDTTSPTYSSNASNITNNTNVITGKVINISAIWNDDVGLSMYINSSRINDTGSWANGTWTAFSGNSSNFTLIYPATAINGSYAYKIYANDTSGNQNVTGVYYWYNTTTLDVIPPTWSGNSSNTTTNGRVASFTLTMNDNMALQPLGQYIFGFDNCIGTFTNDSAVNFTSTPQTVLTNKTLNSTANCTVRWFYSFTDNSANVTNTNISSIFSFNTTAVSTTWANTSLLYKQQINISEKSANTLSNYTVNVTLDTATLISSSKLDSSCNCLAFYDSSESILLPSYMPPVGYERGATGCNVSNSLIWVKIPSVTASINTTIYAYYTPTCGNNYNNASGSMALWDDFTGTNDTNASSTNWYTEDGAYGKCRIFGNALNCSVLSGDGWSSARARSKIGSNDGNGNFSIDFPMGLYISYYGKASNNNTMYARMDFGIDDPALNIQNGVGNANYPTNGYQQSFSQTVNGVVTYTFKNASVSQILWHNYAFWINSTKFSLWTDGVQSNNTNTIVAPWYVNIIMSAVDNNAFVQAWFDNVSVRYMVNPEPTMELIGTEQTYASTGTKPTYSNNATTVTNNTPVNLLASINVSAKWNDENQLDMYMNSSRINASAWSNGTWVAFTTGNWSNFSLVYPSSATGGNFSYRIYANDTDGNQNVTNIWYWYNLTPDTTSPTWSANSTSSKVAGISTIFYLTVNDNQALHPLGQYIFSIDNCTGSFANDSIANFTTTPQTLSITKTINSTVGCTVRWLYNFSDSVGNWNISSIFSFVTTASATSNTLTVTKSNMTLKSIPYLSSCQINATYSNITGQTCYLERDNVNYTMNEIATGVYNYSEQNILQTIRFKVFCNNTGGQSNNTSAYDWILMTQNFPFFKMGMYNASAFINYSYDLLSNNVFFANNTHQSVQFPEYRYIAVDSGDLASFKDQEAWKPWQYLSYDAQLQKEMLDYLFAQEEYCNSSADTIWTIAGGWIPSMNHGASQPLCTGIYSGAPFIVSAVWKVYEATNNTAWLTKVYSNLKWNYWWYMNNKNTSGTPNMTNVVGLRYREGTWQECDNDADWDEQLGYVVRWNTSSDGCNNMEPIDLEAWMWYYANTMNKSCTITGNTGDCAMWDNQTKIWYNVIENTSRYWYTGNANNPQGFYTDYDTNTGLPHLVLTAAGFMPLYLNLTTNATRINSSIKGTLMNPNLFYETRMVRADSIDTYLPGGYRGWTGNIWAQYAYFGTMSADNYGYHRDAGDVAMRVLRAYDDVWNVNHCYTSFESIRPTDGMCMAYTPSSFNDNQTVSTTAPESVAYDVIFGTKYNAVEGVLYIRPDVPTEWNNTDIWANLTIPYHKMVFVNITRYSNNIRNITVDSYQGEHYANVSVALPLLKGNDTVNYHLFKINSTGTYDVTSKASKVDWNHDGYPSAFIYNDSLSSFTLSAQYNTTGGTVPTETVLTIDGGTGDIAQTYSNTNNNITATSNESGSAVYIYVNGTQVATGTTLASILYYFPAGYWNVTGYTMNDSSYQSSSAVIFANVSKATPEVVQYLYPNPATYGTSYRINDNITIPNGTGTYPMFSTYVNSTLWSNSSGLVAYWRMNNLTVPQTYLTDSSGNANYGTLTSMNSTGSSTSGWEGNTTNCIFGHCINFDGINDYILIKDSPSLKLTGKMTLTAWLYVKGAGSGNYPVIIEKGDSFFWSLNNLDQGRIVLWLWNGTDWSADLTTANNLTQMMNKWVFVATTFDSATHNISNYESGQLTNSVAWNYTMYAGTTEDIQIGGLTGNGYFNGTIDDIRIYNRVLSASDIDYLWHMTSGLNALSPGTYNVTTNTTGNQNYSAISDSDLLVISNPPSPTIDTVTWSSACRERGNSYRLSWNQYPNGSATLFISYVNITSPSSVTTTVYSSSNTSTNAYIDYVYPSTGTWTYKIFINDTAGASTTATDSFDISAVGYCIPIVPSGSSGGGGAPTCSPTWVCNEWSTCNNNVQTRSCSDIARCGDITSQPPITQECNNWYSDLVNYLSTIFNATLSGTSTQPNNQSAGTFNVSISMEVLMLVVFIIIIIYLVNKDSINRKLRSMGRDSL